MTGTVTRALFAIQIKMYESWRVAWIRFLVFGPFEASCWKSLQCSNHPEDYLQDGKWRSSLCHSDADAWGKESVFESYGPGARVRQQFPRVSELIFMFWKFGLMVWHFGRFSKSSLWKESESKMADSVSTWELPGWTGPVSWTVQATRRDTGLGWLILPL